MDKKTRAHLETEGYWIGDAEAFLGLTPEESQVVELRVMLRRLTMNSSQSHKNSRRISFPEEDPNP
jgi:hypothetical protein